MWWDDNTDRKQLIESLNRDEISVGDSDTVIGLLGRVSEAGFEGLNKAKQRLNQPYLILLGELGGVDRYSGVHIENEVEKLLGVLWPGPLTVILPAREDVSSFAKSDQGKVALRVPEHRGLLEVLGEFDGLFSTSANTTKKPVPKTPEDIENSILESSKYIILDRDRDRVEENIASTIVDCSGDRVKIVREGAIPAAKIAAIVGYPV